ncbi:Cytochrome c oxidase subunit 6B [Chytridiales sp. JEL 0842]|nr:Cytochrome c oxidase subunit 6B [Chytridiales sp. JEL 0842]
MPVLQMTFLASISSMTKNCWQNYVDYFKCVANKGEDFQPCQQFKFAYTSLCPTKWVEKWDEQREENVFPGLSPSINHQNNHH